MKAGVPLVSTTDVAKYAGVSQTTVSRVLNKPNQVKKETYEKVMNAVNELNYSTFEFDKPAKIGSQLKTICLLVGTVEDSIYAHAVSAIVQCAEKQGYHVTIHFIAKDKEQETYDAVLSTHPKGILVMSTFLNQVSHDKLVESTIPFVVLNCNGIPSRHSISMNDVEAGYLATKHAIERNHIEIAWASGTLTSPTTSNRLLGFVQALQEANFKVRKKRIAVTDVHHQSVQEVFENLQALKKKPTALIAATDEMAIQFMEMYQHAGYQIPEDISIIGIGNSALAAHPALSLTSCGTSDSLANLGQEAVDRLFDLIMHSQNEDFQVTRNVALYERSTTRLVE